MSVTRIASRYAKSLIDLAVENNKLDRIKEDMDTFRSALESRDLYLMLKSPIVSAEKKSEVCQAIFSPSFDEISMKFVNILIAKGRERYMPEVVAEFENQYRVLKSISSVKITTASALDEATVARIKDKLIESKVVMENVDIQLVVDEEVLGGFKVETGDKLYDATVRFKLEQLKKQFEGNLYVSQIIAK